MTCQVRTAREIRCCDCSFDTGKLRAWAYFLIASDLLVWRVGFASPPSSPSVFLQRTPSYSSISTLAKPMRYRGKNLVTALCAGLVLKSSLHNFLCPPPSLHFSRFVSSVEGFRRGNSTGSKHANMVCLSLSPDGPSLLFGGLFSSP
jgi:hypothetical protein